MSEWAAASFPVVFFDGDRDVDVGAVAVHASIGFKKFQSLIAQKIGVSPHQISISLVRRRKARPSPETRRKVPIDESSDFAAIARERDCFVLAVMRRSRRERRGRGRRGHRNSGEEEEKKPSQAAAIDPPPGRTILRRNQDPIGFWDYESQLRKLQRMSENYLLSTAGPYYPYTEASAIVGGFFGPTAAPAVAQPGTAICEECHEAKAEGRTPAFHWCVYDAVTVGFRSPVGPIERPSKKHVVASA